MSSPARPAPANPSSSMPSISSWEVLSELNIKNFAIIDQLRAEFGAGLNVLTGETGAGKSILVDAINLLMGDRASAEMIRTGQEEASVEAFFELEGGETLPTL